MAWLERTDQLIVSMQCYLPACTLTFFILIGCLNPVIGQTHSDGKRYTDINYGGDTNVYHRMDVHVPDDGKELHPVIIVVYGSAFFGNNLKATGFETLGQSLLNAGYAVVAVNHRSSRDGLFPAQIHDLKGAIRYLRANANKYHLDPTFIGITGYSSGGHLSSMAGTTGNQESYVLDGLTIDLEGSIGGNTGYSSTVDAVVDWFGPTDFLVMDSCGSEMVHDAPDSPESQLVGGAIQDNRSRCQMANPATYVDKTDPPFLILHGDKDPLVPWCESEILYQALLKENVPAEFIKIKGGGHGPGVIIPEHLQWMVEFFDAQLQKQ